MRSRLLSRSSAGSKIGPCLLLAALCAVAIFLTACDGGGAGDDPGDSPPGDGLEAPAAPSGLEAASMDGAVGLEWEGASGAEAYNVYRDTTSGLDASGSALETGVSEASFTDEAAENGTTYFYVVTALAREDGQTAESAPSSEVEVTPFSDPPDRP